MYLTYDEYMDMGGTLEEAAFDRLIYRVNGILETATHKRDTNDIMPIKACCRALVDYFAANKTDVTVTSRSQSAGNVSESENYSVKSVDDIQRELDEIITDYLSSATDIKGRPLLYRGALY